MFKYIEKLREKNDGAKKRIAFSIAFVFAGILFLLWLTVFLPQFEKDQEESSRGQAVDGAKSPVSNFIDALSAGVSQIQQNLGEAKDIVSQMSTSTAYYAASPASSTGTSTQKIKN